MRHYPHTCDRFLLTSLLQSQGSQTLPVYMYSSGNIASPSVWLLVDSGDPEHALVGWTIEVIDGGTQKLSFFKNMPGGTQQCSHATATPPEKFVYGFSMCTGNSFCCAFALVMFFFHTSITPGTKPDAMFAVYSESFSVGSVAGDTWENVPHTSYVSVASGCSLLSVGGANTPFGLGAFIATFTNSTSTFPTGVKLPSYCSS